MSRHHGNSHGSESESENESENDNWAASIDEPAMQCLFCPMELKNGVGGNGSKADDYSEDSESDTDNDDGDETIEAFVSSQPMLHHLKHEHEFDALVLARKWRLDALDMARLVNFCRSMCSKAGTKTSSTASSSATTTPVVSWYTCIGMDELQLFRTSTRPFSADTWLEPQLKDDALMPVLLACAFDEDAMEDSEAQKHGSVTGEISSVADGNKLQSFEDEKGSEISVAVAEALSDLNLHPVALAAVKQMEQKLVSVHAEASMWRSRCEDLSSRMDDMRKVASRTFFAGEENSLRSVTAAGDSQYLAHPATSSRKQDVVSKAAVVDVDYADEGYFGSYASLYIHQTMLQDRIRTEAYRDYIMQNAETLFRGRTVLDIGCGTGILSMIAARAGATRVIGIDMSDIIQKAKLIVAENGLTDVVSLRQGMAEEVAAEIIAEGIQIDVIISEWMGYFLLFESMLDSVIVVRDMLRSSQKTGKPGSVPYPLVLPARCSIILAAAELPQNRHRRTDFWDDVYGFRMACMREGLGAEADVEVVDDQALCSSPAPVFEFDCNTVTLEALEYDADFEFMVTRSCDMDAIVGWFDIDFAPLAAAQLPNTHAVSFSTGPHATPTHWKQAIFVLQQAVHVEAGTRLRGHIRNTRNRDYHRGIDVLLRLESLQSTGQVVNILPETKFMLSHGG